MASGYQKAPVPAFHKALHRDECGSRVKTAEKARKKKACAFPAGCDEVRTRFTHSIFVTSKRSSRRIVKHREVLLSPPLLPGQTGSPGVPKACLNSFRTRGA